MDIEKERPPHSESSSPAADEFIRRLSRRYLFVLATIAGLIVVDQVIVQPLLVRLSWYSPVINVAGRQRMLSQRLTKAALSLQVADDDSERNRRRNELRETLAQWSSAHKSLRDGSPERDIQQIRSSEIDREWTQLSRHFDVMCAAAEGILNENDTAERAGLVATATKAIIRHEGEFLASMERIVTMMENEAAAAAFRLRIGAATIAAAVIALLLLLGRFVVRPAMRTIRGQIEDLESQVADRTRELSSALTALRHEMAEREQSESNTRRLAAQLAHAERVWTMGHLASGLAHELNQPLATIANYSEACDVELASSERDTRTERLRKYVDLTKQAASYEPGKSCDV